MRSLSSTIVALAAAAALAGTLGAPPARSAPPKKKIRVATFLEL